MKPFLLVMVLVAMIVAFAKAALVFRARSMRSLAIKRKFRYVADQLPASFCMTSYPAKNIRRAWNVIEGEQNGISVVIFDSVVGDVKGTYCTFVAFQCSGSSFAPLQKGEQSIQDSNWTAMYRLRFWQIPWTLSVDRIEAYLKMSHGKDDGLQPPWTPLKRRPLSAQLRRR